MEEQRRPMRYAHAEGHTDVCYADDGKHILTCGSDGDVRIWAGIEDDDPVSECVGEVALAVAYCKERFYVGTDNNYVQAYTFPEAKRDGIMSRFSAPVTNIAVSTDGLMIAASSCDMEIQLTEVESNKITKLSGHTAPVLGVALDPKLKYVVSSSCDGSVRVWDILNSCEIKKFSSVVPVSNDFFTASSLIRPAWQCEIGSYLTVPKEKEVVFYERDTWTVKFQLSDPSIQKPLTVLSFSPCGSYLAATSTIGEIIVWDIVKRSKISYTEHPKKAAISGLAWHPNTDQIAFCDRLGQLGMLEKFFGKATPESELQNQVSENVGQEVASGELFDDDEDDENAISLEKIKASTGWQSPSKSDDASRDGSESRRSDAERRLLPMIDMQHPFQPSSTPLHFQHRFMLWNGIGIVRCFNTEQEKSIDVECHDIMFHHGLHINNYEDYTMCALSTKVLVLATCTTEEARDVPESRLKCIALNAWDGSKEWLLSMPEGESILAVAAAGNWVAAATDANLLRVFTHTGTQKQILALPGPPVVISGHKQQIFIVCHVGLGLPGCQNLGLVLYEVSDLTLRAVTSCQPLPMTPKSTLKWAGFTDEGTPVTFDSDGVLRALGRDFLHWTVMSDTKFHSKSCSDHYFIIGVSEKYQNIRCILCKGSYYPMTTPRPTVIEIPLKLPLCEPNSEKSIHEDAFWRLMFSFSLMQSLSDTNSDIRRDVTEMETSLKQTIVKLFAIACRGDADMRATDIAHLMCEQPLEKAIKYASKSGKMYLAERLSDVTPKDWSELNQQNRQIFERFSAHTEEARTDFIEHPPKNNFCSQQDLFEETPPIQEKKLLIAEMEVNEKYDNSFMSMTPGHINPFKVKEKQDNGPRGLNFFSNAKVVSSRLKPQVHTDIKPVKTKLNTTKEKSSSQSQPKTFIQWFAVHEASLEQEFPELNSKELTKQGLQRFREETNPTIQKKNSSDNNQESDSQETQMSEPKKRKLNDANVNQSNVKKSVSSKLSIFAHKQ